MHEEENEKPKKGKGILKKINSNKTIVLFAIVLVIGIVLGAYLEHTYIEKIISQDKCSDYNALLRKNSELDKQADFYYTCLNNSGIDPKVC